MKKMILLGIIPLSMLLLSFVDSGTETRPSVALLPNGNYVLNDVDFSKADEAAFEYLEEEYNPQAAELGFFWSCYTKTEGKWQHGRIWGGGCCTSGPPKDCSCESYNYEDEVRAEIAKIMTKYM